LMDDESFYSDRSDSDSDSDDWEEDFSSDDGSVIDDNDDYRAESGKSSFHTRDNKSLDESENSSTASSDSFEERQMKEEEEIKQKLTAIIVTAVAAILVLMAILLGVALKRKSSTAVIASASVTTQPSVSPPSGYPTIIVTLRPTQSLYPTIASTDSVSVDPTAVFSEAPSMTPSVVPSMVPSMVPSAAPVPGTAAPTVTASSVPSAQPSTPFPSAEPSGIEDIEILAGYDVPAAADTYVVTLANGERYGDFPSSDVLLVRARNIEEEAEIVEDTDDATAFNATAGGDDDGFEDEDLDGISATTLNPLSTEKLPDDATSYALLDFDLEPLPWYRDTNTKLLDYPIPVEAYVCLNRINDTEELDPWGDPLDDTPTIFAACRVPQKTTGYSMPGDCWDGKRPVRQEVAWNATMACFDITRFVRDFPPFAEAEEDDLLSTIPVRSRRLGRGEREQERESKATGNSEPPDDGNEGEDAPEASESKRLLQDDTAESDETSDYLKMRIMVAFREKGKQASAKFYSSENIDEPVPQLFFLFEEKEETNSMGI